MTKTKMLLALSLTSFAVSLTGICWGLFVPVGAILLGLFLVFRLLEKESALFDEEQHARLAFAEKTNQPPAAKSFPDASRANARHQPA